jgi:transposase
MFHSPAGQRTVLSSRYVVRDKAQKGRSLPGHSLPGRRLRSNLPRGGRSRSGITTKILALTDALGNLVDFCLMPGQAHDLREAGALIRGLSTGHLLADRAFDADWLRNDLLDRGITPVIPPKSNRKFPAEFDKETYKWRHLIENFFGKLKENRGIAMRSCKTDRSFKAFISIGATLIHTR